MRNNCKYLNLNINSKLSCYPTKSNMKKIEKIINNNINNNNNKDKNKKNNNKNQSPIMCNSYLDR